MQLLREKPDKYETKANSAEPTFAAKKLSKNISSSKGNEKYKDNIFRYLFSNEKNFVQLYYDLTNQILDPNELEFYNTESIVVKQLKNDVAFKTKDNRLIIMVEHQSSPSDNMPLRFLLYYSELIKLYIAQNDLNIFSRSAIEIPQPEFYVVYNGTEELHQDELHLSLNLGGSKEFITVCVKIVNINYNKLSEVILGRNDVLNGYSYLMDRIRFYNTVMKLSLDKAIENAVRDTKQKSYLKDYLNRKEFITMVKKVLTMEEEIDLIHREALEEGRKAGLQEGRQEGRQEGIQEGKIEKQIEIAKISLKTGLTKEIIAKITGLTLKEIEELE